jgi:hypothetical protein
MERISFVFTVRFMLLGPIGQSVGIILVHPAGGAS